MKYKVKIENLNTVKEYDGVPLAVIQKDIEDQLPYPIYLAKLDNAYRALTHVLNHDCTIEFLDLRNNEAWLEGYGVKVLAKVVRAFVIVQEKPDAVTGSVVIIKPFLP